MMLDRRSVVPSRWAILFLAGCCALSMVIAYRVRAAQAPADTPPAATAPAQGTAAPADKTAADKTAADKTTADKTAADKTAPAKGTSPRPPPSKAEESATIQDDPTLVPDDKESADNNVTFPIDI
jgi:cytoskeletal protein RodZ